MELQRFGVTTTVFVNAADADEAALIIERDLAGGSIPIWSQYQHI
jgi:hypothetical protein